MTDTINADDVVENVTNGETEVKNPIAAVGTGSEVEKKNREATADVTEEAKAEKNDEARSNSDKEDDGTHSPDNKRKDTNDHYRDGNKRSRGGGGRGRGGRGRGGKRGGNFSAKNANIVRTFDDQPESNDPVEIRRQVEFYFSDSNLPIDGYLLGMVEASKNLPVDLRTIHNFKRMRHFQPFSAVTDAVRGSEVLDVEERDNTAYVTRKFPLLAKFTLDTAENKKLLTSDTMERSIYAKGFGDETKSTHLDIEDFFAPYGPINSIRLRRTDNGEFKGSVFVEFSDVATQKRFLELDPKPTWGENDKELQIMSKQIYVDRKHQDILAGNVRPKSPRHSNYRGHGGGYKRGGRDAGFKNRRYSDKRDRSRSPGRDDWKQRRDRDQRNGNRDDRKRSERNGRGGRGRGRGDRDRDDRKRRDRAESEERSRSRSPHGKDKDDRDSEEPIPTRAEAEAIKEKELKDANGVADAQAGAEKTEGVDKKRAREEDDDGAAEGAQVKKVRETEVEA